MSSVERFSSRVENYIRYRPGYPAEILSPLRSECGLSPHSVIADIGSGTGKLSELFLRNGNQVIGVEPNRGMRQAAERLLSLQNNFRSIDGSAEATTLANHSVDFVTAGQAFHWFDPHKARLEFARILKPDGWVVLVWNLRLVDTTPFLREYEALLLKYGTDYEPVRHENAAPSIQAFFAPGEPLVRTFPNRQVFDFDGLKGRVLSSSYTPEREDPSFESMINELKQVFEAHQINGHISFDYDTQVFYGRI
jgi:SAM-dependent methyltransferase